MANKILIGIVIIALIVGTVLFLGQQPKTEINLCESNDDCAFQDDSCINKKFVVGELTQQGSNFKCNWCLNNKCVENRPARAFTIFTSDDSESDISSTGE